MIPATIIMSIGAFFGVGLLVVALGIFIVYRDEEKTLMFAMVGALISLIAISIGVMGLMLG